MMAKRVHIPSKDPDVEDINAVRPKRRRAVEADETAEVNLEEGLQAIYGDDRSDLKVVEREKFSLTKFLSRAVLFLALLAMLAYGGFFAYKNFVQQKQATTPLAIDISAPPEVKSGERVRLEFKYQNPTQIPLASLELDVALPSAFALTYAQPEPTSKEDLVWTLGSLGANSDGLIVLEGVWLSEVPSETEVQALATYRPSNFNADFSYISTAKITTLSSAVEVEMTGPEAAVPGEELTYKAKLKNSGEEMMYGLRFALEPPSGFILNSSSPTLQPGSEPVWEIGDLAPEGELELSWTGAFAADVSDVQRFGVNVSLPDKDRELSQATASWSTDVAGSPLRATLVVNGNAENATTELGNTLRVTLRLENASTSDLSEASAVLDFKPDKGIPILWDQANLSGGDLSAAGVTFDAETLGVIKAGEKKTYNLSFPIKVELDPGDVDEWTASVFVTQGGATLQTPPLPISMRATAELSARVRYYSDAGAPLGTGPLPPQVGQATVYHFVWSLDEAVHELEDIMVSATLPPDVTWDGQPVASSGTVNFDGGTQTITWSLSNLPSNQAATAEFNLKFVPGPEDVGTYAKLLSGTSLRATDVKTNTGVLAEVEPLTTELLGDTFALGRGTIIE